MTHRITRLNCSFWLSLVAYAIGGATLFFTTFRAAPFFSGLDGLHPIPIRFVMFIGPFGWLTVALLGALATLPVRSTTWKLTSAIIFLCLVLGVICTLLFTNIETPMMIRPGS